MTGGDDYEILCTVPPDKIGWLSAPPPKRPMSRSTDIGKIAAGKGARFIATGGKPLKFKRPSFSHF